jgi:hypothetical protein
MYVQPVQNTLQEDIVLRTKFDAILGPNASLGDKVELSGSKIVLKITSV